MPRRLIGVVREWLLRVFAGGSRRRADSELRAELEHHLAMAEADLIARGCDPAQARRLARARHGQADNALEQLRRQRGIPWFGAFTIDVRLGLRMLRKFPGLTLIGGLALTVGFAVLTTVFAYFDLIVWNGSVPTHWAFGVGSLSKTSARRSARMESATGNSGIWSVFDDGRKSTSRRICSSAATSLS